MVQSKHNKLKGHHSSIDYVKIDTLVDTLQSMFQKIKIITKKKKIKKQTN